MEKQQQAKPSLSKAFEINQDTGIYGTFAEIGAGQETVNFFYKAGLASKTVAKSMSAYDMTVSDEIYGKQNRYVSKNRLINMLSHEYPLLEKRLKRKVGGKTCFFVFATTAATSTPKKQFSSYSNQHAWMGLRFQANPLEKYNDVIFHVSCLDKNRLQQYEALGILGVNLIHACFKRRSNAKKLISSLTENLSGSRIEIQSISCLGSAFKNFSPIATNLEVLSQDLSSLAFFPSAQKSELLSDLAFNKSIIVVYNDNKNQTNIPTSKKTQICKLLGLEEEKSMFIFFIPKEKLQINRFKQTYTKPVLTAPDLPLNKLKILISKHTKKPLTFIISKSYLKKMFHSRFYKTDNILKSLGTIFDKKTKVIVEGVEKKKPSIQKSISDLEQESLLKNYLVTKKQILYLS